MDDEACASANDRLLQRHLTAARLHHGISSPASQHATPIAGTKAAWVPEEFLAKHWKPEELDLPPWSPMSGETAGASLTSTARAQRRD